MTKQEFINKAESYISRTGKVTAQEIKTLLLDLAEIAYQNKLTDVYQSIITSIHPTDSAVKLNWQNQTPVPEPSNLSATVEDNHVMLSWQNNAEPALIRNIIKRSEQGTSNWEVIADVPGSTTSFTDRTVTAAGDYEYMIEAVSYSQEFQLDV